MKYYVIEVFFQTVAGVILLIAWDVDLDKFSFVRGVAGWFFAMCVLQAWPIMREKMKSK